LVRAGQSGETDAVTKGTASVPAGGRGRYRCCA